jgi:type II secretory pathway pseudopilin PulG
MKSLKYSNEGFTLIETLVAMAIFSMAVIVVLAIFVNSQGLQQRTLAMQRGQSDARYALELMARKIRLGEVDYECYNDSSSECYPLINPVHILALRDANGNPVRFRLQTGVIQMCTSFSQVELRSDQSEPCTAWVDLTPTNVITVNYFNLYIMPTLDPFEFNPAYGTYAGNEQEKVTILLGTTVAQTKGSPYLTHFQTTVSSRSYKR